MLFRSFLPKTLLLGDHVSRSECAAITAMVGSVPQNVLNGAIQFIDSRIGMIKHYLNSGIIISSPKGASVDLSIVCVDQGEQGIKKSRR